MNEIDVTFVSHHAKAQCAPDPAFPDGMRVDLANGAMACTADLPYPAECRGVLLVRCRKCGSNAAITTAGRPDDPRRVVLPCKVGGEA